MHRKRLNRSEYVIVVFCFIFDHKLQCLCINIELETTHNREHLQRNEALIVLTSLVVTGRCTNENDERKCKDSSLNRRYR